MKTRLPLTQKSRKKTRGQREVAAEDPQGLLDDVRATVIALLATIETRKQRLLKNPADSPEKKQRALAQIHALEAWVYKTLDTLRVLEKGKETEWKTLREELDEYRTLIHPSSPPKSTDG